VFVLMIQVVRSDLAAVPIWQYRVNDDTINFNQIIADIYEIKKSDEGRVISNIGGWQSNGFSLNLQNKNTEIDKLMHYIKNNVQICHEQLRIRKVYQNLKMEYWININSFNNANSKHTHPGAIISGSVYIKVPKNSGNIYFCPNILEHYFYETYTEFNTDFAHTETEFIAEEKKVILFPSFLPHYVARSNSHEDRISIAFNLHP